MEIQKIINLLDSNDNESQKFATKRWYIINDQNTGNNAYGNGEDGTTIKFETKVIKPNLCDYSDAYILVTGNIQNNNNLTKQLNDGFKRSIYWNQYVSKPFPETPHKKTGMTRVALDAAFQGVNRLFVLAFEDTRADEVADAPAPRNLVANRVIRDS